MTKLTGKVALVSGSGRGIGRSIALKLAREGAKIVVNDLDAEPGNAVVAEIKAAGGEAVAVNGSVTETGFADRFVGAAVETFGGLDIIVNNAGYTWDATIQKMTDEQFQAMLDVHLVAPFRILRAAAEPIRIFAKKEAEAGREVYRKVVNISSIAGLYGNAGQASYSAAKASLVGLTRTLCKEWGRYKVNVNCVAFGLIGTRLTQAIEAEQKTIDVGGREIKVGIQPQLLSTMDKIIPLGRAGTPDEAADAVYLFCSPESNYISGQVVVCGGGLLM
ncbi:3-oxoacyl-[acyl-carrier protein] reductase [Rhizobiales bacterium GAS191]|nr:3-oxoacyl-[acyl-carrier protein] reductase [Rhizobiales bacterium GAS113]SEC48970.1 3-oxoacyl-[acyl-carrier protein] reductase [Rhizobiales bacterium GAS191]